VPHPAWRDEQRVELALQNSSKRKWCGR